MCVWETKGEEYIETMSHRGALPSCIFLEDFHTFPSFYMHTLGEMYTERGKCRASSRHFVSRGKEQENTLPCPSTKVNQSVQS